MALINMSFRKSCYLVLPSKYLLPRNYNKKEMKILDYRIQMPINNSIIAETILLHSLQIFNQKNHKTMHKVF